jgi:NOL1/NOP2/sun family putative RNA methylase
VEKYSKLTDFEEYKESVVRNFARKSIRVNTLRFSVVKVKKSLERDGWILKKIPWCKEGFYIEHSSGRRDIGNTEQHKKGMFFSQGSPSMIPAQLMGLKSGMKVLDMCAAPGGKTQHIACLLKNKGKIIANDLNRFRRNILKMNLERCGVENVVIDNQRAEDYLCSEKFDAILLDAPCTGSGLIKGKIARTKKLLKEWNPKVIEKYVRMQMKMLESAYECLKSKGRIVYVTCSMEPEEDELLVESFLKKHGNCRLIKSGRVEGYKIRSSLKNYIKIWPQYYDTNGLFIGVIEKS